MWKYWLLSPVWLFATTWTLARQAALSTGFSGKNTGVGCQTLTYYLFIVLEMKKFFNVALLRDVKLKSLTSLPTDYFDSSRQKQTINSDSFF